MIGVPVDLPPSTQHTVQVAEHRTIETKATELKPVRVIQMVKPKTITLHFANNKAETYDVIPPLKASVCYKVTGYASPVGKKFVNEMLSALRAIKIAQTIRTTGVKAFAYAGGVSLKYGRAVVIKETSCEQ